LRERVLSAARRVGGDAGATAVILFRGFELLLSQLLEKVLLDGRHGRSQLHRMGDEQRVGERDGGVRRSCG
jgi:hypothetical protein